MIDMYCYCGEQMSRQPLGHWKRNCDCKDRRYWASCAPTKEDRTAFYQLTHTLPPETDSAWVPLYGYGVSK